MKFLSNEIKEKLKSSKISVKFVENESAIILFHDWRQFVSSSSVEKRSIKKGLQRTESNSQSLLDYNSNHPECHIDSTLESPLATEFSSNNDQDCYCQVVEILSVYGDCYLEENDQEKVKSFRIQLDWISLSERVLMECFPSNQKLLSTLSNQKPFSTSSNQKPLSTTEPSTIYWQSRGPGYRISPQDIRLAFSVNYSFLVHKKLGVDHLKTMPIILTLDIAQTGRLLLVAQKLESLLFEKSLEEYQAGEFINHLADVLAESQGEWSRQEELYAFKYLVQGNEEMQKIWNSLCSRWAADVKKLLESYNFAFAKEWDTTCMIKIAKDVKKDIAKDMDQQIHSSETAICFCFVSGEYYFRQTRESGSQVISVEDCKVVPDNINSPSTNFLIDWQNSVFEHLEKQIVNASPDTTRHLALSKVAIQFMFSNSKRKAILDYSNDLGIHIQYSCARIEGIKRSLVAQGLLDTSGQIPKSRIISLKPLMLTPIIYQLIDLMHGFQETLKESRCEPSKLITYLSVFSKLVSSLYYHIRLKGEDQDVQLARWMVYCRALDILQTGLVFCNTVPIEEV